MSAQREQTVFLKWRSVLLGAFFMGYLLMGYLLATIPAAVAEGCGTIAYLSSTEATIADCENPFSATTDTPDSFLIIDDQEVRAGDEVEVVDEASEVAVVTGSFVTFDSLFVHTDEGYRELYDEVLPEKVVTPAFIEAELAAYFAGYEAEVLQLYKEALLSGGPDILTPAQEDELITFILSTGLFEEAEYPLLPELTPGTYTALFSGGVPCLTKRPSSSFWETFFSHVVPVAHAQCGPSDRIIETITFTITLATPEPEGAASVIFLPGIQASRLYTSSLFGEDRLWEPNFLFDRDTKKLAMDETGTSITEIYTRDAMSYISDDPAQSVYGSFITQMEELVSDGTMVAFETYAYDWRYDIYDLIDNGTPYESETRYLTELLEELALDSHTGQVTIIGHSNGGLLGKALLSELEANGNSDLVDNFIMIGTPQLGTPEAIGGLLHGFDQGIKAFDDLVPVVTEATAREVTANMPGAYNLLPGALYLELADTPVLTFRGGAATEPIITAYGAELSTQAELDDFLTDAASVRGAPRETSDAIALSNTLLADARSTRLKQDTWQAPASVAVHTIVGTGRNTVRGFTYEPISEVLCQRLTSACIPVEEYKPIPLFSTAGDETVMAISAMGAAELEQDHYYVDLQRIEENKEEFYFHYNLTEAPSIQQLVTGLITGTSSSDEFISRTRGEEQETAQLLFGTHSPVYLYLEDAAGRKTGQLSRDDRRLEIPGTNFFTLASSSYIIAPKDGDYTVHINAYDRGGVTLTLHEVGEGSQPLLHKVPVSSITGSTTITLRYKSNELSPLTVDEDGDTLPDYEVQLDGTITEETADPEASEDEDEVEVDEPLVPEEVKTTAAARSQSSARFRIRSDVPASIVAGMATTTAPARTSEHTLELQVRLLEAKLRLLQLLVLQNSK